MNTPFHTCVDTKFLTFAWKIEITAIFTYLGNSYKGFSILGMNQPLLHPLPAKRRATLDIPISVALPQLELSLDPLQPYLIRFRLLQKQLGEEEWSLCLASVVPKAQLAYTRERIHSPT